jgi:glycerophosphoryl diester phosphodiesterase
MYVIAHRGASAVSPENTIASFKQAIVAEADIIEMDVHLSRDDEVVVIHDSTLWRTTNGKGKVNDHSLDDLKKLDAGSWFNKDFFNERIPTLKEVLTLPVKSGRFNVELKGTLKEYPNLPERVVEAISSSGMVDKVVITSFNPEYLEMINRIAPDIEVGEIHYMHLAHKWKSNIKNFTSEINPLWFFVTRKFVRKAHAHGIKVHPWTTNNAFIISRLGRIGVDGIITNDPAKLIDIMKQKGLR